MAAEAPSNYEASLCVGDLHPNVTEVMLFNKFASVGPIQSIRVCHDMTARQSFGYAYVNFEKSADAKRALDTMNFDLLCGRPLCIMWSHRDSTLRESDVGNVFIKNLNRKIDNKFLYDTFSAFGNILSCKIMTDKNGKSRGFGFVHFETQEEADNAIDKVNGMLLANKKVYVDRIKSHNQQMDANKPWKFTNVFIKNFGDQLDEEKLRELFSKYGKILSLKIEKDESGHSKGFGFCRYENSEDAEEAVQNLNGYSIGDKQLYVDRFQNKNQRLSEIKRMNKYQGVNLYIKNLDDTIDDEQLKKEFSKFGIITSVKVMSKNGRSKGFGFVCFSESDEAKKAVAEVNGSIMGSRTLYVALAERKQERRTHVINQHKQRIAISRALPPISLPFSNEMNNMMPYVQVPLDPLQSLMKPTTNAEIIDKQMPQSAMLAVQQSEMLKPTQEQMMPSNFVRSQVGAQSQQKTANTHMEINMPFSNPDEFPNSIVITKQESLITDGLANATQKEQNQMLDEHLSSLIQQMQLELADKITDMLLEIDNPESHTLESPESLQAKVEEAIAVLQAHQAKQLCVAKHTANKPAVS
ncbi:unnamed protein product [Rotaria sp. Silwood1]|nr:unnamed protein product [Rotaria sp. Silwood1]